MIREWDNAIANNLAGLMTLAGNQQDVSGRKFRDRPSDCFRAIANFDSAGRVGQNCGADCRRILAARVVVRNNDSICIFCRDPAHDWTLAGIPVATRTEYDEELAPRIGPQTFKRLLERVRLVGIIDENGCAIVRSGKFEPAFGAGELLQCGEYASRLGAGRYRKPGRYACILHLKSADKR